MTTIELYFDYVSPYAYLAWVDLGRIAARRGLEIQPRPVLFAGLLGASGALGPAEIPAKRRWMWRDVVRCATRRDVPFRGPPAHPFNPLLALRVSLAAPGPERRDVVDALFRAAWEHGRDLADPNVVRDTIAGLDPDALLARAASDDGKRALRDATQAAIDRGVFGVPTCYVGDEPFFGADRLDDLELHLDGKLSIDEALVRSLIERPAAATRSR